MKIIIVAGGTGGHIYPGIALAQEIKSRSKSHRIIFIGGEDGLERNLVNRAGFEVKLIKARALLRKLSYKAVSAPFFSIAGLFQSLKIIRDFQPDALISTGGYASFPVVMAAKILSVPIYIHEQNVLPGITNRIYSRLAKKVFLSFDESKKYLDGEVVGNPIREEIVREERESARKKMGISEGDKLFLVVGGSQGARELNRMALESLPLISSSPKPIILHILGQRDKDFAGDVSAKYSFYRHCDYIYDINEAIAAADFAVSRAGATAISEFLLKGVPMLLVPFPYSAEGHQDINAQYAAQSGAAIYIKQSNLDSRQLADIFMGINIDFNRMKNNCNKLARPNAAKDIINAIS